MRRFPVRSLLLIVLVLLLAACSTASPTTTVAPASAVPSTAASSAATSSAASVAPGATIGTAAVTATRSSVATPVVPAITGNLTIFAASSLTDAFNEMKGLIEAANPGTKLTFNYAASSALRTQLEQGAQADLFASADQVQLANAQKSNLLAGDGTVFVRNTPVIIVPKANLKKIAKPQDLVQPGVKLVLAAPEVPIGNYSRQIFDKMSKDPDYGADFNQKVQANIVSNEANVRQVVSKIQLGEGDAGIVYASDVTPAVRDQITMIPIPEKVNVIAEYPVAALKGASNAAGAQAFVSYLLSSAGQAILQKWGFVPVRASNATPTSGTSGGVQPDQTGWFANTATNAAATRADDRFLPLLLPELLNHPKIGKVLA